MPDAQWFENNANKYKANWNTSDRFTELDKLDLTLTNKLAPIKQVLLQYANDPVKQYQLSSKDKKTISTLKKYAPSLFKEPETITPPQKQSQQAESKAQNIAYKLAQTGLAKGGLKAYDTMVEKGIAPEIRDVNFINAIRRQAQFPLQKVLSGLNSMVRGGAASYNKAIDYSLEQTGAKDKGIDSIIDLYNTAKNKNITADNVNKTEAFTGALKTYPQALKEFFKGLTNNSEYVKTGYTDLVEKQLEGTKFTQPFKVPEDWGVTGDENKIKDFAKKYVSTFAPNETGNWWQRLTSGFAGSPADIAGLTMDIVGDPLTYLSGGLATGAKTGFSLFDDLIKSGTKVLPKGAEIGLTKTGRIAYKTFLESDEISKTINAIQKGDVLPSVVRGITGIDDVAKQTAIRTLENQAVNKFLQQAPDAITLNKWLDFGGTKVAGQTIIKGATYKQLGQGFEKTKLGKIWQNLFNAQAGIPQEFRLNELYAKTASEADKLALQNEFANIIKKYKPNENELEAVQKYFGLQADIEKATNKLDDISNKIKNVDETTLFGIDSSSPLRRAETRVNNLINKYDNAIKELKLNDKQLSLADELKVFAQKTREQLEAAGGAKVNPYEWYAPIRYKKAEETAQIQKKLKELTLEQPFMQERKISTAQANKLGLENKDLITSWNQRLWEQEMNLTRTRMINEVRQFTSDTAKEGYQLINDIPELKGLYLPQEYIDIFKKTYLQYFGDNSLNKIFKAYDKTLTIWKRLALFTTGYDIRNFLTDNVSGLMQWGIGDFYNPKTWDDATNILRKKHVPIKLWNGEIEYADDIYKKLVTNGTLASTQTAYETGSKAVGNLFKKIDPTELKFKYISNPRENLGRTVGYLIERKHGAGDLASAAVTKGVFFDYMHSLTRFEKNIARRFINPFWSWQKNNLRRQFELLFTRTGQYAAIPKTMNFIENISDTPENFKEYQADYMKDLGMIATPFRQPGLPDWLADLAGKPLTNKAGDMLVGNPNFAFQDWSRLNPKDMASALPPTVKVPIELIANKNLYFDTPIRTGAGGSDNFIDAPALLQKLGIKRISETADYLLGQNPLYALGARMFPAKETDNTPYQTLSAYGGVKFTPYNEEKSKEKYMNKFSEEASNAISQKGEAENKEQLTVTDYETALKYIYDKYAKDTTGYSEIEKIKEAIKLNGNSNQEIDLILKLKSKPYEDLIGKSKGLNLNELVALLKEIGIEPTYEEIITALNEKKAGK